MRTLTTLAVGGSPFPGMVTTTAGLPWPAALILSVLGLTAATVLAWRMETNRQSRYELWVELADKKVGHGQTVDLNGALEDALAPPRQVADLNRRRWRVTQRKTTGKAGQP